MCSAHFTITFYIVWILIFYINRVHSIFNGDTEPEITNNCTTPMGVEGRCVPYKLCGFVTEQFGIFGDTLPREAINFLWRSRCTVNDTSIVHFCCELHFVKELRNNPPAETTKTTTTTTTTTTKPLTDNEKYQSRLNPRGLALLNQNVCGIQSYSRISNGKITKLAEFPWMALLIYQNPDQPYQCGGSLITNRYVLTAAHCLIGLLNKLIGVRLGEYDTESNRDCGYVGTEFTCLPPHEDFGIENQIPHPGYSKTTIANDVALLRLDRNVGYKAHIKPICLPTTFESAKPMDTKYTVAGWGLKDNQNVATVLLKAQLEHKSSSFCQNTYTQYKINTNHICAKGNNGSESCYGDSGGPLVSQAELDGRPQFVQYGVVSFGALVCSGPITFPGIYSNLIETLPWITDNIV